MVRVLLVSLQFMQNLPRQLLAAQNRFSIFTRLRNVSKHMLKNTRLRGLYLERCSAAASIKHVHFHAHCHPLGAPKVIC